MVHAPVGLINDSYDFERGHRLELLATFMEQSPKAKVRDLQREALKYYPVSNQELVRDWMKLKTAFAAAKILNDRLLNEVQHEQ
jgi:hypothetical protein